MSINLKEYTDRDALKEAVTAEFTATANEHLAELKRVYIERGVSALWDAYRNDNGIGYQLTDGNLEFLLLVSGAESAGQAYVGELAGEAACALQGFEMTQEFTDRVAEAEGNGEQDPEAAARRAKCEDEKWEFADFSNVTEEAFLGEHLQTILAAAALPAA